MACFRDHYGDWLSDADAGNDDDDVGHYFSGPYVMTILSYEIIFLLSC